MFVLAALLSSCSWPSGHAEKAQAFVDSLSTRRSSLEALEGEPDELIASIESTYADGAAESEGLEALHALQGEMSDPVCAIPIIGLPDCNSSSVRP